MASTGTWLYAITNGTGRGLFDDPRLRELTGVGDGPLHAVEAGGLTAIGESVSLSEFGEAALRRNLEDLDWLESTARGHHQIVDALAGLVQIVPVRLATVYSGDDNVRMMLAERSGDFRDVLRRITARAEWGVKAFAAQPAPAVTTGRTRSDQAIGAGAAYLRRRRDELDAREHGQQQALANAEHVHAELSALAAEARLHPPQSPQLTGAKAAMVLNAAYLLEEQQAGKFRQAVHDLDERLPLQLELTGPWPPYSFADLQAAGRWLATARRLGRLRWLTCWTESWPAASWWLERSLSR